MLCLLLGRVGKLIPTLMGQVSSIPISLSVLVCSAGARRQHHDEGDKTERVRERERGGKRRVREEGGRRGSEV